MCWRRIVKTITCLCSSSQEITRHNADVRSQCHLCGWANRRLNCLGDATLETAPPGRPVHAVSLQVHAMTIRLTKIALSFVFAAFAFLVTFDNITDYASNYVFVQHVLSMDTTFRDNALMYRSITTHAIWNIAYWLIIASEGVTFVLL